MHEKLVKLLTAEAPVPGEANPSNREPESSPSGTDEGKEEPAVASPEHVPSEPVRVDE